jgi:hypothetical protein
MRGVKWWVPTTDPREEGPRKEEQMDLQESMLWFSITTVLVVVLLLAGIFLATHTYDHHDKRIPH